MSAHAKLSPSGADRWTACPGSLVLEEGIPNTTSDAALAGTIGHAAAELMFLNNTTSAPAYVMVDGVKHEVPEDTAEAVEYYVQVVRDTAGEHSTILPEVRIEYGLYIGVADEDAFGTSDAIVIEDDRLHVFDLKLGRKFVEVEDNAQLMTYAIGAVGALSLAHDFTEVVLHIVQPYTNGRHRLVAVTMEQIEEFRNKLAADAKRVAGAKANHIRIKNADDEAEWRAIYLNPGASQCQWCRAKSTCPAILDEIMEVTPATVDDFDTVDDDVLFAAYNKLDLIKAWVKAVETDTLAKLLAGGEVGNLRLVKGREGNRAWDDEEAAKKILVSELGLSETVILSTPKLKTVAQVEKEAKKLKVAIPDALVTRAPAKPTVARPEEGGEPWVGNGADASEFDIC